MFLLKISLALLLGVTIIDTAHGEYEPIAEYVEDDYLPGEELEEIHFEPPHIIFIHADDLGYEDLGFSSDEYIETPHIDMLASDGIIFDQNYAPPSDTQSRAAFMTGRYPYKIGMQHGLISDFSPSCLPTDVPLLSEKLQTGGYQTHLAGKWQLGHCKWECCPTRRGFDSFRGMLLGMGGQTSHMQSEGYDWWKDEEIDRSAVGKHTTDLIKDRAIELIEEYQPGDKPMFMWLTFTAPHVPYEETEEYRGAYAGMESFKRQRYLEMVTHLDDAIGEIDNALMDSGMWDNTILVFTSDNGGVDGGAASNWPYRGGGGSLFEGGTKVVGFITGPGWVDAYDNRHEGLIHAVDWMPTLLYIAGVDYDESYFDGVDQVDMVLWGDPSRRDSFVYNIDIEYTGKYFFGNAAIRDGEMKLIWGFPGYCDGYGTNVTAFHHNELYLSYINTSNGDYSDIPEERPYPAWISPQEKENQKLIVQGLGIDGLDVSQSDDVIFDTGFKMLFNLTADDGEETDLWADGDYANIMLDLQRELLRRIREEYVKPNEASLETNNDVLKEWKDRANPLNREDRNWMPGWCDDLDLTLPDDVGEGE